MICLELPSTSVAHTAAEITRYQRDSRRRFSDSYYLRHVIELLRAERKRKGLATQEVAKLAKLREGVIIKAEKGGVIPSSREFRAWARSLGFSWEQLWTMAFPSLAEAT